MQTPNQFDKADGSEASYRHGKKMPWCIEDVITFEYFIREDSKQGVDQKELHQGDSGIGKSGINPLN